MKIFILDKNMDDINTLKKIIHNNHLGFLVGVSDDPLEGVEEIMTSEPDLIILDMLDEEFDGFRIIKEIKEESLSTKFIMISNFTSKANVEKAYIHGVEYFIYKPINYLEVETIIKKVKYKIELEEKMNKIQQIFNDITPNFEQTIELKDCEQDINLILFRLGIMGEIGSEDLVKVANFLMKNRVKINDISIRELCSRFTNNPKAMEQRMRRTINVAMSNIASLGIEDYMNETFVEYSNTLFNFEQIKREMDYIRGKNNGKGSINMKKFLSGLCILCEKYNN